MSRIEPGVVIVSVDGKDGASTEERIACDHVVLATGAESDNGIAQELADIAPVLHVVGDARTPRKALDAIHEGFDLGLEL